MNAMRRCHSGRLIGLVLIFRSIKMRVVIDAFGGDNAPLEIVKGAALA